jgi:hypothetical protein
MKKLIYISIFLLTTVSFAQTIDLNLNQFVGNWEYDNGTETFKVELFMDTNNDDTEYILRGHYQLVNNNTGEIIYKSNKTVTNGGATLTLWPQISVRNHGTNNLVSGTVTDNVLFDGTGNPVTGTLFCSLAIEIQDSCRTCPTTATWKVKCSGPKIGQPTEPTIPINIVLTKVD